MGFRALTGKEPLMRTNGMKFIASIIILILALYLLCDCTDKADTNNTKKKSLSVIMVTDQAGLGDHGFNDSGWAGLQRAAREFDLKIEFIQSQEQADYIPNLAIASGKADIVVAMGFLMSDAVRIAAMKSGGSKFIFIDGKVEAPRVESYEVFCR